MIRLPARKPVRRAYLIVAALATLAVVVGLQVVLARCVQIELQRERDAALRVRANEVFASARAWSDRHANEIVHAAPTALALDGLLPPGVQGCVTLQRMQTTTGAELIACDVTLNWSRTHLHQVVYWPPPAPDAPVP